MTSEQPRPSRQELAVAVGGSVVLLGILDAIGTFVPFVAANLLAIVAAVFLYLPSVLLPQSAPDPIDYGLHLRDARSGVVFGLLVSVIIVAGFIPGHHAWSTIVHDRALTLDAGALRQSGERLRGRPLGQGNDQIHVWHDGERIHVRWQPDAPWTLAIETDGELRLGGVHAEPRDRVELSADSPRQLHLAMHVHSATHLDLVARIDGSVVAIDQYVLGGAERRARDRDRTDEGGLSLPMGYGWLGMMLLAQILLVAIPEEFFYRGYLQKRLDEAHERHIVVRIGPVDISRSNLIASTAFALGHLVIGWAPIRLAVFFPSLLFGWMRDRTGTIAASVTCHVACNAMVHIAAVFYLSPT